MARIPHGVARYQRHALGNNQRAPRGGLESMLRIHELGSQPSHRKRLKTAENKGFLTFLNAMGRSVPLKTPIRFQIANKINGFVHVSYGAALNLDIGEEVWLSDSCLPRLLNKCGFFAAGETLRNRS